MKIFLVVLLSLSALVHSRPDIDRTYLPPSPEQSSTEEPETPVPTYLPPGPDTIKEIETQTQIYLQPSLDSNVKTETQTKLPNAPEIVTSSSIIEDLTTVVSIAKDDATDKTPDETFEITTSVIVEDLVPITTIKSNEIEQSETSQPSGVYLLPRNGVTTPIPIVDGVGIISVAPQKDNGKTPAGGIQDKDKEGNVIPGKTKSTKGSIAGEGKKIISKEREGHSLITDQSYYSSPGQDYFQFESPSKYNFGYEVNHPESQLNFGHHESREEDTVTGGYFVLLPDGRKQIVEYVADKEGYHPRIRYESPAQNMIPNYNLKHNQQPQGLYRSAGIKDAPFSGPELVGNSIPLKEY